SLPARLFVGRFFLGVVFHRLLTGDTPIGRKARPFAMHRGAPLIRAKGKNLDRAGVRRAPRVAGVRQGMPLLEDGSVLEVENVIWCPGFSPGFEGIKFPIFDAPGEPEPERGIVAGEPGFSSPGLHFLYAMSSTMIHGAGRDARRIVDTIAERTARAAEKRSRSSRPRISRPITQEF